MSLFSESPTTAVSMTGGETRSFDPMACLTPPLGTLSNPSGNQCQGIGERSDESGHP